MKKIITKIIITSLLVWYIGIFTNIVNAEWEESLPIVVEVTEEIPWANCTKISWEGESYKYQCEIQKWTQWVIDMLWSIIKYFSYIVSLVWVLFLVYNWILYSMWWADQSLKDDAKNKIVWTLIWLIVLFLSWAILVLIAPWIYK